MPYKDPVRQKEARRRWQEANPERSRESKRRWREANPERHREASQHSAQRWRKANPERSREVSRYQKEIIRQKALEIVSRRNLQCALIGPECRGILEIDHVNGGGEADRKRWKGNDNFYRAIVTGKREINDLRILCLWHNRRRGAEHYRRRDIEL